MLEKLNLKCPVDEIKVVKDVWELYDFLKIDTPISTWVTMFEDAEVLLTQRKQWERMLEGLIGYCINYEANEWINTALPRTWYDLFIETIEQCTGMAWDEVKEKIGK